MCENCTDATSLLGLWTCEGHLTDTVINVTAAVAGLLDDFTTTATDDGVESCAGSHECTDVAPPHEHLQPARTCAEANSTNCADAWADKRYCRATCAALGYGYAGDGACCSDNPTPGMRSVGTNCSDAVNRDLLKAMCSHPPQPTPF